MVGTRNKAKSSANKVTSTKWGKEHNLKLQGLFLKRNDRGGVNSKDLNSDYIKRVFRQHFPDRQYNNFAPLFRAKARKFNLNEALDDARQAKSKYLTEIPLL